MPRICGEVGHDPSQALLWCLLFGRVEVTGASAKADRVLSASPTEPVPVSSHSGNARWRVAALYVEADGCYFAQPYVDLWDKNRDARLYAGPHPVVAHPPCDRWHMLSAVNNKRWGFRINEDDGCFAAALSAVRTWGGVLEHPAQTRAFRFHGIPQPTSRGWQRTFDGDWITEVDQAAYGHRARKATWLLYHGAAPPPELVWRPSRGTLQIGHFDKKLPVMRKAEALATPKLFRDLLLTMARSAGVERKAA